MKFELLFSGTVSKDAKVLDKMLALLDQPEIVKPQDQLYLFVYLYRNPRSKQKAYKWLCEHFEDVRKMGGDKTIEGYPRYMAGATRTEKEFEDWKNLYEPMQEDPAMARAIKIGKKEIAARLELIEQDKDGVIKALKK